MLGTNAAYLELHTYTSRQKQSFAHNLQKLVMCSVSHMADVETILQLVLNFAVSLLI
jgi:hypothetical protein